MRFAGLRPPMDQSRYLAIRGRARHSSDRGNDAWRMNPHLGAVSLPAPERKTQWKSEDHDLLFSCPEWTYYWNNTWLFYTQRFANVALLPIPVTSQARGRLVVQGASDGRGQTDRRVR